MPNQQHPLRRGQTRGRQLRRRIAVEAARLISESGLRDYQQAKRKAAQRLGIPGEFNFPDNGEIQEALREHQRLFHGDSQPEILRHRREAAREALRFFAPWEPRLVGAVLDGSADVHSAVCLHLHTDHPNAVALFLRERAIPYRQQTRRLRLSRDTAAEFPVFLFSADDIAIDLTVLPYDRLRQAPLDRIDERPMRRVGLAGLEEMLERGISDER
ncbi:MAG TPA: hypothetical protein VFG55_07535 [Rhodanobacteraceae bacterium]|nr:hypothetical protein [Rhodanobacteraceae bacterium]